MSKQLVRPIKGTAKHIGARKTKGATNEKRVIKGDKPPYSTHEPGGTPGL